MTYLIFCALFLMLLKTRRKICFAMKLPTGGLKSPHLALPFLPREPELPTWASGQKEPSYIASHAGFISLQTELLHNIYPSS